MITALLEETVTQASVHFSNFLAVLTGSHVDLRADAKATSKTI